MVICDKTINIKIKPQHNNSKSHELKKEFGIVVKEYEFSKPDIDEVNYILNGTIRHCRSKNFHSFQYRCVNDIKFMNMEKNEEIVLTITLGYMK